MSEEAGDAAAQNDAEDGLNAVAGIGDYEDHNRQIEGRTNRAVSAY